MQMKRETRHCEGAARGNPVVFAVTKLVHTSAVRDCHVGFRPPCNDVMDSGNDLLGLDIPLLFAEDAAAVFLDVHLQLPGLFLTGAEIGAEVAVLEFDAVRKGGPLGHLPHELVVLVGGNKQRGGKAVEATLGGSSCGLKQAHLIALDAAVGNILRHLPDEGAQGVVIALDQGQVDGGAVVPQAVAAGAVLGEGMDVGILPIGGDVEAVGLQNLDALVGAGSAAGM